MRIPDKIKILGNALEAGLYQVLKDNDIDFREGCE
jgi:hypothetical protein